MLETELKCLINEDTFNNLRKLYTWNSSKIQENHYYVDTAGVLSENRTVFRIRFKEGKYLIQVKAHKNKDGALQVSEESEFETDSAPEKISAELGEKYTGLKTGELVKLGYNTTLRYSYMWDENTEICLDKTDYFDITDYEIEIEYTNGCPQELLDELKSAGVEFTKKCKGKYSRFISKFNDLMSK